MAKVYYNLLDNDKYSEVFKYVESQVKTVDSDCEFGDDTQIGDAQVYVFYLGSHPDKVLEIVLTFVDGPAYERTADDWQVGIVEEGTEYDARPKYIVKYSGRQLPPLIKKAKAYLQKSIKESVDDNIEGQFVTIGGKDYVVESAKDEKVVLVLSEKVEMYWVYRNKKTNDAVLTGEKHDGIIEYWDNKGDLHEMPEDEFEKAFKKGPASDLDLFEEIKEGEDGKEESEVNETAGLDLKKTAVNGKAVTVWINGYKYSYEPNDPDVKPKDLANKFTAIAKHSAGRALAWLKKNATTKDSYKKKEECEEGASEDQQ